MFPIPILDTVLQVIGKIIPDPAAKAAAQLEVLKLNQAGEFKELEADLQMAQGQIDINKTEAASDSLFVAGWRPFIGWTCGAGFAVQFVVGPFATWASALYGKAVVFPQMDTATMMPLLFGMLGLGAYRTFEKVKR